MFWWPAMMVMLWWCCSGEGSMMMDVVKIESRKSVEKWKACCFV